MKQLIHKKEPTEYLGFIPARFGSERIPEKNIKKIKGHPLIAYTISAAVSSKAFKRVIVSTDSEEIKKIALKYGAEVPFLRPDKYGGSESLDIEWIKDLIQKLRKEGETAEAFAILRPTSPFRQPETINRAIKVFEKNFQVDSLRAVEKCNEHPAKMWYDKNNRLHSVMKNPNKNEPEWHAMQYKSLPVIYIQNASLEIAWCDVPLIKGTREGDEVVPFFTEGYEGFDINFPHDWLMLESLIENKIATLPKIINV